jgi:iron complex transport system substrate-binding protein
MMINLLKRAGSVMFIFFFCVISSHSEIVTDDMGRQTNIILPVRSIVSLSPAQTEIIYALGGGNKLKAVSINCDYPAPALAKEKAGSFLSPDIEKIVKLKPDVVLATGELQDKVIEALEKLQVKVVVFYPQNISGIEKDIRIAGKLLGNEKTANQIIENINKATSGLKQNEPVKVYVELWGTPAISIGRGSFMTDIISKAGGINILTDLVSFYPKVSPEEVIKRDPDVILLLYTPETGYVKRSWFKLTKAGRLGNIFIIGKKDRDVMLRPGPRILQAYGILTNIFDKVKTKKGR